MKRRHIREEIAATAHNQLAGTCSNMAGAGGRKPIELVDAARETVRARIANLEAQLLTAVPEKVDGDRQSARQKSDGAGEASALSPRGQPRRK